MFFMVRSAMPCRQPPRFFGRGNIRNKNCRVGRGLPVFSGQRLNPCHLSPVGRHGGLLKRSHIKHRRSSLVKSSFVGGGVAGLSVGFQGKQRANNKQRKERAWQYSHELSFSAQRL